MRAWVILTSLSPQGGMVLNGCNLGKKIRMDYGRQVAEVYAYSLKIYSLSEGVSQLSEFEGANQGIVWGSEHCSKAISWSKSKGCETSMKRVSWSKWQFWVSKATVLNWNTVGQHLHIGITTPAVKWMTSPGASCGFITVTHFLFPWIL